MKVPKSGVPGTVRMNGGSKKLLRVIIAVFSVGYLYCLPICALQGQMAVAETGVARRGATQTAQASRAQGGAKYEVIFEYDVATKMRDGVTLRADIYRPQAEGKFPVLLQRRPYNKTVARGFGARGD